MERNEVWPPVSHVVEYIHVAKKKGIYLYVPNIFGVLR